MTIRFEIKLEILFSLTTILGEISSILVDGLTGFPIANWNGLM
jgi:hypothetical protein